MPLVAAAGTVTACPRACIRTGTSGICSLSARCGRSLSSSRPRFNWALSPLPLTLSVKDIDGFFKKA
eukprot:1196271-Prorocentrum_minimum.AAC.2